MHLILTLIAAAVVGATWLVPANIGDLSFITPAHAQPATLTPEQSEALHAYDKALADFKSILAERRAQIDAKRRRDQCVKTD